MRSKSFPGYPEKIIIFLNNIPYFPNKWFFIRVSITLHNNMEKKHLFLAPDPARYSYLAIRLRQHDHPVVAIGKNSQVAVYILKKVLIILIRLRFISIPFIKRNITIIYFR
jgi:hypothetical protein